MSHGNNCLQIFVLDLFVLWLSTRKRRKWFKSFRWLKLTKFHEWSVIASWKIWLIFLFILYSNVICIDVTFLANGWKEGECAFDWVGIMHVRGIREFSATIVSTVFTNSDKLFPTVSSCYSFLWFFPCSFYTFILFFFILYSLQSIWVIHHFKIQQHAIVWC